jgi:hypothetical protein
MEAISAAGKFSPPMIPMAGILMKEKHFNNGIQGDTLFGVSESGYTNDWLSYQWLQHWEKHTRPLDLEEWRLLIMDGHGSHMTMEFIEECWQWKVKPFVLPPHSTHLLQPRDVGVFQSYKHFHQEELEESIKYSGFEFEKADFLACFQSMRDKTFKEGQY